MKDYRERCPICESRPTNYFIDETNLEFLSEIATSGQSNSVITLARVAWHGLPELRLSADSKVVVQNLAKSILNDLRVQVSDILQPMQGFVSSFHKLVETLPEEIRSDVQRQFDDTKTRLEEQFKALREGAPKFQEILDAMETISVRVENAAKKEMDAAKHEFIEKFKESLSQAGFPEPAQMKLLAQFIPSILPLLEELVRFQKVPNEKGKLGEVNVLRDLKNHYMEDDFRHIGGPGDTDILAKPRHNGTDLDYRIIIESKMNHSGWNRVFIRQVRNHMKMRNLKFAILAVEMMPKNGDGFMIEHCPEGVLFVTSRDNLRVAYGALRSVFIALDRIEKRTIDLRRVLADKRVEEAIFDIFRYEEQIKSIRSKAARISGNAQGILEVSNDLDQFLKQNLKKLQSLINEIVEKFDASLDSENQEPLKEKWRESER